MGGAGYCHRSLCAFLGGVVNHRDLPVCAAAFLGVASAERSESPNTTQSESERFDHDHCGVATLAEKLISCMLAEKLIRRCSCRSVACCIMLYPLL